MGVKPVFHLRIFSREANFSFVFIQLVPVERSKTNKKFAEVENRLNNLCVFTRVESLFAHAIEQRL